MKKTLTARLVEAAQPRPDRRYEIRDTLLPGFGLRVSPNARKTWFAIGRVGGRQIRATIGTFPVLSLAEAREAGREILKQIQLGLYEVEPAEQPSVLTFEAAAKDFIERHAKPKNRDWKSTESVLRKFASLNDRPLSEIKRQDVIKVLDEMVAAKTPIRANRALAAIKKLFAWSLDRGLVEVHPVVGLKAPGKEVKRERVLTDKEVEVFWKAAAGMGHPFGPALLLLLATGQRRCEVTGMRWSNIDFDRAVWTIPGEVAKNGRVHEVPLSKLALDIIQNVPRFGESDFLFTTTGTMPISGMGKVKYRLDTVLGASDWRFHDLRRTAASGMARLGVAPHVIEKVLNHVSGQISGVAAIYNRHGYDKEKREALDLWADDLQTRCPSCPRLTSESRGKSIGSFATQATMS